MNIENFIFWLFLIGFGILGLFWFASEIIHVDFASNAIHVNASTLRRIGIGIAIGFVFGWIMWHISVVAGLIAFVIGFLLASTGLLRRIFSMNSGSFHRRMVILLTMVIVWLALSYAMFYLTEANLMEISVAATISAVIMCLTILRQMSDMLISWLIDYLCGVNNYTKVRLEKFWLTPDSSGHMSRNPGISRLGHTVIWLFWILLAAIASAIRPVTTSRIQILFQKFSMIIVRMTGNWLERFGFALELLLTITTIVVLTTLLFRLYLNAINILQGMAIQYNIGRGAIFLVIYSTFKKVYDYVFFGYGLRLVFQDILFWTGTTIIIALIFGVFLVVDAIIHR